MSWSWKVVRLAGVDVYIHWTFLILIGWILFSYLAAGSGIAAALVGVGFVLALFGCVVLHELGHATAARYYGVPTRDITLYPIGGVARLARIPQHPVQEFVIAIAGPLVNVLIAGILGVVLLLASGPGNLLFGDILSGNFLPNLLWANVILVVFNLIPAFPMDGGRMVRALMAAFLDYSVATRIAAGLGQAIAIVFAIVGLFFVSNPILLFIALFIYLGAAGEAQMVETRSLLRGVPVREAMITRFRTLSPDDSLRDAARELLAGVQRDFPVVDRGVLVGMLYRKDLTDGLNEDEQRTVSDLMRTKGKHVTEQDLLESVMVEMQSSDDQVVPVVRGETLVGLIDTDNIGEWIMIRAATAGRFQRQLVEKVSKVPEPTASNGRDDPGRSTSAGVSPHQ